MTTKAMIQWFIDHYEEEEHRVIRLLDQAIRVSSLNVEKAFEGCSEIRKHTAAEEKSSLDVHLNYLAYMCDMGYNASEAGEVIRTELLKTKTNEKSI